MSPNSNRRSCAKIPLKAEVRGGKCCERLYVFWPDSGSLIITILRPSSKGVLARSIVDWHLFSGPL
jgi:hypothetical protein